MMTVVSISVILFMLVTVLFILTANLQASTRSQVAQTKATHMADAGLNAYLYELRRNPTYYLSNPTLGPTTLGDGVWSAVADAPVAPGAPLVVHATGSIPSMGVTETIIAEVRFPTYAAYMFLTDADLNIGADAVIDGKIRSNGDVDNSGRVTGRVFAAGSVSGTGQFDDSWLEGQPIVDFSQVTMDMQIMRQLADDAGVFFTASGGLGFRAVLNGTTVAVYRVTGGVSTGNLTTTLIRVVTVPSEGVLYFDEDVWVSGSYSTKLTIAGARDIYIDADLEPSQLNRPFTCGLVAQRNVIVPTWYPSLPQSMTLTAAMLAQTGSIYGDYHTGVTKTKITINGSMAYNDYGYFALYSGGSVIAGFRARDYNYDERLEVEPPPHFPQLRDGSLNVSTWFEE